jgi:REP element-mobilizing transposase RayT
MARPLRIEYPGAFYHVICRGNEKRNIFNTDSDRRKFLACLKELITRYHIKVHTYCLMNNHYHLVIETPEGNLTKVMHTLNSSYTAYFNATHKRRGHLFQGRYKAILVQADEYLHHLSRYIHVNPVRAKVAKEPHQYPWSSYRDFIGKRQTSELINTKFILSVFDKERNRAQRLYRRFVEEATDKEANNLRENIRSGFILGDSKFLGWVRDKFVKDKTDKEIPQLRQLRRRITIEQIEALVKKQVDDERLCRKVGIYLSRKYTGKKLSEIGRYYGELTEAGVSRVYSRLEKQRRRDKGLDSLLAKIEKMSNVKT